jgi:hypothetical protein
MKIKAKNKVTRKSFVEWIMREAEDYKTMMLEIQDEVIDELVENGKVTLTIEGFYNRTGYIPQKICVNSNGDEEYTTDEVELIDEKEIYLEIISNYIDWFTSDETEREKMKANAELYLYEDEAMVGWL